MPPVPTQGDIMDIKCPTYIPLMDQDFFPCLMAESQSAILRLQTRKTI